MGNVHKIDARTDTVSVLSGTGRDGNVRRMFHKGEATSTIAAMRRMSPLVSSNLPERYVDNYIR